MLEVAIGLGFIYLLLSLLCTAINEWISQMFAMRAQNLKTGIRNLLNDENLYRRVYEHPLIRGFYKSSRLDRALKRNGGPSYISSGVFSTALLDLALGDKPTEERKDVKTLVKTIESNALLNPDTKKALKVFIMDAAGDFDRLKQDVADWYDNTMERVSGWYKRKTKFVVLGIAVVVCVALNADTLTIANSLLRNTEIRSAVAAAAGRYLGQPESNGAAAESSIQALQNRIQQLDLPLGWVPSSGQPRDVRAVPQDFQGWFYKLAGLLLTVFAVSLGAPFWFDLVNRVANLRSSGSVQKRQPKSD